MDPTSAEAAPMPAPAPSASGGQIARELFAGTVSGWAQVMTGQPFDIVKVRLQSGDQYKGMVDCATRILKDEGPLAFYKGTAMPLVGIGACVSLQFAFLQAGKRFFAARNRDGEPLSLGQFYLAGAGAGVGNSVVSGPVEHIRIRLQTQTTALYSGPLDALKKIYAADGIRGVYHGQGATLAREFHGFGVYFLVYEAIVARHQRVNSCQRTDIPVPMAAFYGALAGWGMWLTNYPLDVIKSRLQTDGFPSMRASGGQKYQGAVDCARQLWQTEGAKGFFRGFTPTMIRSPFVNGATFAVFELTMRAVA